jgi:hypothetical protein
VEGLLPIADQDSLSIFQHGISLPPMSRLFLLASLGSVEPPT